MPVVVTLSGDLTDLEAKLKAAGIKVKDFGDDAESAGKQASDAFGSDLEKKLANIEDATKRAADASETLASHAGGMNELAEGFGNTERVALGVNDVLGVMAEQFGVNIGPAQEWAQAAGDVAGGLEGIIGGGMALVEQIGPMVAGEGSLIATTWAHVTALYAQAAAFIAANLPMIAMVATVALIAAGIYLLITHWDDITAKVPILGEAVDVIKTKLGEFGDWITKTFIPAVASLYDPAIKAPLDLIVSYFALQFDLVKIGIETVLGVIKGIVDVFMGVFTGDWGRAWEGVKEVVDALWTGIKDSFNAGVAFFTDDLVPRVQSAGSAIGGALMDGLKSALSATAGFAGSVADAVLGAVKSVVNNFVIDPLNGALQFSWDTHIPGLGTVGIDPPDIPRMAKGGIVTSPTLALIGEAGPEVVIPLNGLASNASSGGFSIPIPGLAGNVGGGGSGAGMDAAANDLVRLVVMLSKLDEQARNMWLADPKNQLKMINARHAAAGLPLISSLSQANDGEMADFPVGIGTAVTHDDTPGIGTAVTHDDSGPSDVPGGKPKPGSAGGVANGGGNTGGAGGGAGGGKKDDQLDRLVELGERDQDRRTQELQLLKQIVDALTSPQELLLRPASNNLDAFIALIADRVAQLQRRQGAFQP